MTVAAAAAQMQGADMERSCLGKRRYWSFVDAMVMAFRRQEARGAPELATYCCRNCGGWHLTRQV
jgi:hypothetical protein